MARKVALVISNPKSCTYAEAMSTVKMFDNPNRVMDIRNK